LLPLRHARALLRYLWISRELVTLQASWRRRPCVARCYVTCFSPGPCRGARILRGLIRWRMVQPDVAAFVLGQSPTKVINFRYWLITAMLDTLCAVLTGLLASKRRNTACAAPSVFCPLQKTSAVIVTV
jgi:hypothetical protein